MTTMNLPQSQARPDTQYADALGAQLPVDQRMNDTQGSTVDGTQLPAAAKTSAGPIPEPPLLDHTSPTANLVSNPNETALSGTQLPPAIQVADTNERSPGDPTSDTTNSRSATQSTHVVSDSTSSSGQRTNDAHDPAAAAGPNFPDDQGAPDSQSRPVVGDSTSTRASHRQCDPHTATARPGGYLRDPLLGLLAEVVDDLETVRIANTNRVRILTRTETDSDGEERGFGLTVDHPEVAKLLATVNVMTAGEKDAIKNLENAMKKHALGKFVKATPGLGLKQTARLLAAIGDPYWNDLHDRPRTVSELWAYCGFHVIRTSGSSQLARDTHPSPAAAGSNFTPTSNCGSTTQSTYGVGVAPKRTRGQKSNWSETARKRTWVIASAIPKFKTSPYEPTYRAAREKYADTVHPTACVRCGPAGKPAPIGSPRSAGHQNAMAIRIVAKEILKDLWIESKAIYGAEVDQ